MSFGPKSRSNYIKQKIKKFLQENFFGRSRAWLVQSLLVYELFLSFCNLNYCDFGLLKILGRHGCLLPLHCLLQSRLSHIHSDQL